MGRPNFSGRHFLPANSGSVAAKAMANLQKQVRSRMGRGRPRPRVLLAFYGDEPSPLLFARVPERTMRPAEAAHPEVVGAVGSACLSRLEPASRSGSPTRRKNPSAARTARVEAA